MQLLIELLEYNLSTGRGRYTSIHFLASSKQELRSVSFNNEIGFTYRSMFLSSLVFTSVRAVGHLGTAITWFQRISPESAGGTPILRLAQLPSEFVSLFFESPDCNVCSAHFRVLPGISFLAHRAAVPYLAALPAGGHHAILDATVLTQADSAANFTEPSTRRQQTDFRHQYSRLLEAFIIFQIFLDLIPGHEDALHLAPLPATQPCPTLLVNHHTLVLKLFTELFVFVIATAEFLKSSSLQDFSEILLQNFQRWLETSDFILPA